MKNLVKYLLIAIAILIPYWIIAPASLGGWILYFVIAVVAAGAVETVFRRVAG